MRLTRHENFVRTGFKLYVFALIDQRIDIAAELALLTECLCLDGEEAAADDGLVLRRIDRDAEAAAVEHTGEHIHDHRHAVALVAQRQENAAEGLRGIGRAAAVDCERPVVRNGFGSYFSRRLGSR